MFLANNNEFKSLPREDSSREYNSRRAGIFSVGLAYGAFEAT
jgi:hypothetical protein